MAGIPSPERSSGGMRSNRASEAPRVQPQDAGPADAKILRFAAFSNTTTGGNPAGVVLNAVGLDDNSMQQVAFDVGYAETAFVTERSVGGDPCRSRVRYFSPIAEVPFCGHATIALTVALSEISGPGAFTFETKVGPVVIETALHDGALTASFTSVEPQLAPFQEEVLAELLRQLGLTEEDIEPGYPPRLAFAGNWHPVLVVAKQRLFDSFTFDPSALRKLMDAQGWEGTVTVLHRSGRAGFEARNLFPVGDITEDPATGAAAAAVGGYLRILGLVDPPSTLIIKQGRHVGRPGQLTVDIPVEGGIRVSGNAVRISDEPTM